MCKSLRHLAAATLLVAACAKPGNLPVASVEATVPGGTAPYLLTVATGSTVHLDAGKSRDSDGKVDGALTYEWSLLQAPRGSKARIESPANKVTRFTPDVPSGTGGEDYLIQLVVKTQYFASDPVQLRIAALECGVNAPVTGTLVATPSSAAVQVPVALTAPGADDKDNSAQCQPQLHGLQTLGYAWSIVDLPAGSQARLSDARATAPSFIPDVPGTYTAQLVITDSTGRASAPGQVAVNVAPCGGAVPLIDAVAFTSSPVSPNLLQPTQLLAKVSDADSGTACNLVHRYAYRWSIVSLPKGSRAALNSAAVVAPSFTPDVEGDYRFRLVVTNERGTASAPTDHVVTAKACGSAPPVPTISFQPASVGVGTPVQFDVKVDDADSSCGLSETFNYRWSLVTVPTGSFAQLNNAAASRPSFTPDQGGDYVVGLQVTDSSGTSASASAHVTVKTCGNSAPLIDSLQGIPATPLVGSAVALVETVSDANSACPGYDATQTFRWSIVTRPAGSAAAIVDPTAASTRFTPDVPGSYQVQLVVTNAVGVRSPPRIVTITTSTCGSSAPFITATAATPSNPDPGSVVTLFANPDDVDNAGACGPPQALSLQWALVSRPFGSNALLSNPSAASPTFSPDKVGSYQFTVVAVAANGLRSAPSWLTVATTTCGTGVPSVTASPASLSLLPHDSVTFSTTPSESASCASTLPSFSYAWQIVSAPAGSSAVLSDPASPGPSFSPDAAGDYLLQVVVSDDKGARSQPAFVHLTVSGCASLGPSVDYVTATAGGIGLPVSVQAHALIDRNCLAQAQASYQYQWQLTSRPPSSQSVVANPTATQTAFTPDVAGAYQVQLVVTDGLGLRSLPVYRTVTIAPCTSSVLAWDPATPITATYVEPDGSTVTPLAYRGSVVTLGARFTDTSPACNATATAPFSYRWALVARPAGSSAALSSASAAGPAFVPDVPGDYQVAAVVTDALGTASAPAFLTVRTQSCGKNLPQVAVSPSGAQVINTLALQAVQVLGLTATTADSDPAICPARFANSGFTYAWSIASMTPGGRAQLSSATGTGTSFEALTPGTFNVQVVATAANGLSSAPATVSFVAGACGSHAPVVLGVSTLSGGVATSRPALGSPVRLTAAASDADITPGCSDSLTYQWSLVSEPAGSLVNAPAGSSTNAFFDFTTDVAGAYAFSVVATDSTGLSSAPFPVSVTTGACGPVFGALTATNLSPSVGSTTTASAPAPTDACVQAARFTYAWSIATRPAASRAVLATPGAPATAFTPDVSGSYVLQLVVTDSGGFASAPAQLTLTAGSCGALPPTLGAVAASIATPNIGDAVTLAAPLTDNNLGCAAGRTQPYTWQWSLVSAPARSQAALASATDAAPTLVPDRVGAYQLSVFATDALGNISAPQFFTLITSSCGSNQPTVAIAPQPAFPATQLQVNALTPLALTAAAADADNACPAQFHTTFSYAWSVVAAPASGTSSLGAPTSQSTSFVAAAPGSYLVQVVATSAGGLASAPATVAINTSACGGNAPVVAQVTTQVSGVVSSRPAVGAPVTLTATALDPDNVPGGVCSPPLNQAIAYAWSPVSTPAGANLSTAGANAAAFTFTPAVAGTYVFSVVATDSTGLSSAPFTVTVPTGSCGPNLTGIAVAGAGPAFSLSHLPATLTDACVAGGSLAYAWSVLSRPAASSAGLAAPSTEAQSFTADAPGTYQLQLVVTDSGGFSTAATATLTAGGCAAGPSIAANAIVAAPAAPFRDDVVHLSIPAAAIAPACGSGPVSYEWALISRPASSQAQLDAANVPSPSFTADVAGGVWQAMLIVRDSLGNPSAPQFVTVSASPCGATLPQPAVAVAPGATPYTFAPVTLTATTADPGAACPARFQSSGFTYAWSIASQPPGAPAPRLTSSGASAQLTALAPGAYQVALVATGTTGPASAPVLTTVTAQQCGYNAPTVSAFTATQAGSGLAAPATLDNNLDVVLGATVSDLDNTACAVSPAQTATLAWTLVARPAGSAALLRFPAVGPVLKPDLAGTYSVQAVATDSTGLTGSGVFSFTTSPTCGLAPPVAQTFRALQTLPVGAPISVTPANSATVSLDLGYPVQVGATVTDGDAACGLVETVAYAWTLAAPAGSRATLAGAGTAAPGFIPDVVGVYTLSLTLTDSTGLRSTSTFAVSATCGAAPPMAIDGLAPAFQAQQSMPSIATTTAGTGPLQITSSTLASSALQFYAGTPIQLAANVVDGDAACGYPPETFTYAWSFASAPAGSVARFVNPAAPAPTFVPDLAGEYDVQLTVTDSTGRSTTRVFAKSGGVPLVGVSSCGAQLPTAQIGIDGPRTLAAPVTTVPVLFTGSTVLFNGGTSSTPDAQPLDLATGAGCGLAPVLSYAWSFVSAPAGGGDFTTRTLSNPAFVPGTDGLYTVQLVVSEGTHRSFPATATLQASSPSGARSTFTAAPTNNIVANGVATSLLTATARDAQGNPIAGVPGTISAIGSAITLTQAAAATDASGSLTATLASTVASAKSTKAQFGSLVLPSVTVVFVPGQASQIAWTTQPIDAVQNMTIGDQAGQPSTPPVVTVEDAQGNPVLATQDGAQASLVIALGPNPPVSSAQLKLGTRVCPRGITAAGGVFTFDSSNPLSITQLGNGFTLLVTGSYVNSTTKKVVALAQGLSVAFNVVPPPLPKSAPTGLTATPGVRSIQLSWNVFPDSNLAGYNLLRTNPDASTTPVGGLIAQPTTTFTDTGLADGSTYGYQVRAINTGGAGPYSTPPVFATTAPPAPVISTLTPGVSSAIVSWTATQAATSYNLQRATALGGPYAVVLTVPAGTACSGTACQATDTGLTNQVPYFYEVDATNAGGSQTSAAAGPVIPTAAPDAKHSGLTLDVGSPNPAVADNTGGAKLLVTALDPFGQVIPNTPVTFQSSAIDPGDTFSKTSGFTDASGQFRTTLQSRVADAKTFLATVGPSGGALTLRLVVQYVGGTPTHLAFVAQPGDSFAGQQFGASVAALDANNNPTGQAGSVTVALINGGAATLSGTRTLTLQSGVASFLDLSVNQPLAAGNLRATTSIGGVTLADSAAFNISAAPAASVYGPLATSLHTCSIAAGKLSCWGPNGSGQLGNGTTAASAAPVQVGTFTDWTAVATGNNFTCGLRGSALFCWGDNTFGQLGLGSSGTAPVPTPQQVAAGTLWTSVSAGSFHACATDTASHLSCWGSNQSDQIGLTPATALAHSVLTGSSTYGFPGSQEVYAQTFKATLTGNLTEADVDVYGSGAAAGISFYVEVYQTSGGVPVGAPFATSTTVPAASLPATGPQAAPQKFFFPAPAPVQAGLTYAISLHASGATPGYLTAYDNNNPYPDGAFFYSTNAGATWITVANQDLRSQTFINGVPDPVRAPAQVNAATWSSVSAGGQHTCGLQANSLYCFGLNTSGQTGTASFASPVATPAAVGAAGEWASVAAGSEFTCATKTSGGAFCFGRNDNGQLGSVSANQSSPVQVGALLDWTQVSAGFSHACGRHTTSSLSCWGANESGELGDGTLTSHASQSTVAGGPWSRVAAGFQYTCAISAAGAVSCWGNDASDALGTGTPTQKPTPVRVDPRDFRQVVAGSLHSCALRSDGAAWCSGSNARGQLGDGTLTDRSVWTLVAGGHAFTSLTASVNDTCGLTADGALWCWGQNDQGQVGDGTAGTDRFAPTRVGASTDWLQVATGGGHACGTRGAGASGNIYCWGGNAGGDLGDATVAIGGSRNLPGPLIDSGYALAVAGGAHSCGVKGGGLFCWGANDVGELAQPAQVAQSTAPVQAGAQTTWTTVAAGGQHGCALQGTQLSCWGGDSRGQVGTGVFTAAVYGPSAIGGSWANVSPGPLGTCAVTTSGTLFCWGANDRSQLGLGDTVDRAAPLRVGADSNWASVATGLFHACGLRTDGSLWCWGSGTSGQLGDGGPNRASPTPVLDPATAPAPTRVASALQSSISVSRTALPADGTSTTSISVLVKDAGGAAVANQPVTLTVDGVANALTVSSAVTDGAGALVATLSSTAAQAKTITAAVAGFNLNVAVLFQALPPAQGTSTLTLGAARAVAGTSVPVSVVARDAAGNPAPGRPVFLTLNSGAAASFAAANGFTDAAGSYVTTISSPGAESDTVTAAIDAVTLNAPISFFGPASQLVVTQQPQSATPGTSIGNVQVAIEDALGNVMTNDSASTVTLALGVNPTGASLAPVASPAATVSMGVATFSGLSVATPGKGYTLLASGAGFTVSSSAFDINTAWLLTQSLALAVNDLKLDPTVTTAPAAGYAATSQGVFRTSDGGATWAPYTTGMGAIAVTALAVDKNGLAYAGTTSGVYKRAKGAAAWSAASGSGSTALTGSVKSLVVGNNDPTRLWSITTTNVFVSSNSAGAWSAASTGLPVTATANMAALAVSPVDATQVLIGYGDGTGVFLSAINAGAVSWGDLQLPASTQVSVLALDGTGTLVYAATRNKNLYVLDGSGTWSPASTGGLPAPVRAITAMLLQGATLFTGYANGKVFSNTASTVLATGWTAASTGLPALGITALAADPTSGSALFSAQPLLQVYRSTNSGGTWASSSTGLRGINAIAVDPATPARVYAATTANGVQLSTDSGLTFAPANAGFSGVSQVIALCFDRVHALVWAATDAGVYSSPTGAAPTWTASAVPGNPRPTGIAADANGNIYLSTVTTFFASPGNSGFAAVADPATTPPVRPFTAVAADAGSNLVLVGAHNAIYSYRPGVGLAVSTGGPAVPDASALIASAVANASFAAAPTGLFRGDGAGLNFAAVTPAGVSTPFTGVVFQPAAPGTVYAGSNGAGVFRSTDGGATFTAVNSGLDPGVTALAIDPATATRVYAGSAVGGFYKTSTGGL